VVLAVQLIWMTARGRASRVLTAGIELGEGGRAHQEITRTPLDMAVLDSRERSSAWYFDLARALVQDGARRDAEAIRHLDTADRLAPTRIRNDPLARELVRTLHERAPHPAVWELDSLRNRFGMRRDAPFLRRVFALWPTTKENGRDRCLSSATRVIHRMCRNCEQAPTEEPSGSLVPLSSGGL
jgi:hypothetical protein